MSMGKRYFASRSEAGQLACGAFSGYRGKPATVIALNPDALIIGCQLSQYLQCPLQLYLSNEVVLPGQLTIGDVNAEGGFSYGSNFSDSEKDYFYQEFQGYIEETKRQQFSQINRELGSNEVIRRELINGRDVIFVDDCLNSTVVLDSAVSYIKPTTYKSVALCSALVLAELVNDLKQRADFIYYSSTIDFFYGKDHYFEDNKVFERAEGIELVSRYLKLWPA